MAEPRTSSAVLLVLGVVMAADDDEVAELAAAAEDDDDLLSRKMLGLDRTAIHSFRPRFVSFSRCLAPRAAGGGGPLFLLLLLTSLALSSMTPSSWIVPTMLRLVLASVASSYRRP